MRGLPSGAVIVALILTAGCAGPITGPQALRGLGPCLPPEVSPQFFFWPVAAFRTINLVTEDGEAESVSWVLYRRGRTAIAVVWLHSDLISVDPSPETETPRMDRSLAGDAGGRRTGRTPDRLDALPMEAVGEPDRRVVAARQTRVVSR